MPSELQEKVRAGRLEGSVGDDSRGTVWDRNGWWVRRLIALPIQLVFFAVLVFFIAHLVPGDPVATAAAGLISKADADARRAELGLNLPLFVQLVDYLRSLVTLNFGNGVVDGAPILGQIAQRLPTSLQLAVLGMIGTLVVAVGLALVATVRRTSVLARAIRAFSATTGMFPDFTLGVFGILLFYTALRIAPAPLGLISPDQTAPPDRTGIPLLDAVIAGQPDVLVSMLDHLWLPVLILVICYAPIVLRVLLPAMEKAAQSPSLRFRVSVGNSRPRVYGSLIRHSLPTTISAMANMAGLIIGGTIIVEKLFGMGGLGQYAIDGVLYADYQVIRGFLVIYAAITMVIFLVADILIRLADPRRRTDGASDD